MKKFFAAIVCVMFLWVIPAIAADDHWSNAHNATGVSEAAVKVIKKIPLGPYDLIIATFDPVTTIAGSGCTVEGGATSFKGGSAAFYVGGGVTLSPSQFRLNEVLAYWFADAPMPVSTHGTTGVTGVWTYKWVPNAGSGVTVWKMQVLAAGTSGFATSEYVSASGNSIFVGKAKVFPREANYYGINTAKTGTTVTSSTTFYATKQLGWSGGVTPYMFILGKR
ncbi:MAG: hypothetical protein PHC68_00330 [Syntrophorhabdaceae bacterium]|nr:hypothetical protein [Syntrophorhabdaceae bacterium]